MKPAIIAALLAAPPVFAEADPTSEARMSYLETGLESLRQCVDSNDPKSCLGVHSRPCVETIAQSHADEGRCMVEEMQFWRLLHGEYLGAALQIATEGDTVGVMLESASIGNGRVSALLSSEVAWEEYVNAQCDLEMIQWGAGTITLTERPLCYSAHFAERLAYLKEIRL